MQLNGLICFIFILVNVSKDVPVVKTVLNATKQLRSISVGDISIYETCINGLEPMRMINDNIVYILLRCVLFHMYI